MKWQVNSSSTFSSFSVVMTSNSLVNFKLIHFLLWIKESHQILRPQVLWWKFTNFLMSFLKAKASFPSNFASIFSAIKHNSLYFFSSSIMYFGQRQPIKMQMFEIFKCSGQNSSKSSCKFWNDKSIPLPHFHLFPLSWQVTPLWILSWYIFYFG